jgi:PleD family two-component response regulator
VSQLRDNDTPDLFLQRADRSLYRAKNTGRNRVVTETDLVRTASSHAA